MPPRLQLPAGLRSLTRAQAGVLSVEQMLDHGLTPRVMDRLRDEGTTITRGVVALGRVTWEALAWAGVLRGGPDSALGGAAACHVLRLVRKAPATLTVWHEELRSPFAWRRWRVQFRRGARHGWGHLRRTTVEESLLDLAHEADEYDVVEAVTRALSQGHTTVARLDLAAGARPRLARRRLFAQLCSPEMDGVGSVLEWLFDRNVLRPHRIGGVTRQERLDTGARVDVWFEGRALVAELDGRAFHDPGADAERDNRNALELGITTLRFTWDQVLRQPCRVAAVLGRALSARGAPSSGRTYRNCAV